MALTYGKNTNYPSYGMQNPNMVETGVNPYIPDPGSQTNSPFGGYGLDMVDNPFPEYNMQDPGGFQSNPLQQGNPLFDDAAQQFSNPPPEQTGSMGGDFPTSVPLGPSNNNLNYPTYDTGGGNAGTAGSVADLAGTAALTAAPATGPAAPLVAAGGLGLKAVGLGLSIYDKAQQRKQAKENYEMMLAEYERRTAIEEKDRAREAQRQQRQEGYFASNYAMDLGDRLANVYTGQRVGGQV